mmetsp:Transcript_33305/g.61369  ORF Transcript_33305/g.61369 Transcript_33305/m.61369 type:complete len:203 (-) Transcript_33305:20-628(-)
MKHIYSVFSIYRLSVSIPDHEFVFLLIKRRRPVSFRFSFIISTPFCPTQPVAAVITPCRRDPKVCRTSVEVNCECLWRRSQTNLTRPEHQMAVRQPNGNLHSLIVQRSRWGNITTPVSSSPINSTPLAMDSPWNWRRPRQSRASRVMVTHLREESITFAAAVPRNRHNVDPIIGLRNLAFWGHHCLKEFMHGHSSSLRRRLI